MCKNKEELTKLVRKQRKASALKKKLEEQIKGLNAEISEYVLKKGEPSETNPDAHIVFGEDYKVSVCIVTQRLWDGEKLKALLGPSVPQYQNPKVYPKVDIR